MIKYPVLEKLNEERWRKTRKIGRTCAWYPITSYASILDGEDEKDLSHALFVLPYPPTCNHFWQSNGKRRFRTKEYKEFVDAVCEIVGGLKMRDGDYYVEITQFRSDNRKKVDISNRVKALEDALTQAGLWKDDSMISEVKTKRGLGLTEVPCVVVRVFLQDSCWSVKADEIGLLPKQPKPARRKTVKVSKKG